MIVQLPRPILLMFTLEEQGLRHVLTTSSIEGRNSTTSTSIRRCWRLAANSGGPFKLSGMRARTLHAGAPAEELHVDVKHQADGWPLVGCILMVDAFSTENGATRFVPGSHLQTREPGEVMNNPKDTHPEQVLACGPAGSIIIFNASVWHGYSANKSSTPRRSIAAHFVPRDATASPDDPSQRTLPETLLRIGSLAKYVLNVGTSNKPMHATCEDARV